MADIKTITLPDNNTYHFRDDRITDSDITRWDAASGGLTIDDYLDADSTNPVQNMAIYTAIQVLSTLLETNACVARGTNTSQTSGTSVTQVTLNKKEIDTNGNFTISSGGVQVNKTGYYKVSGSVYITPASGTTTMGCYIKAGSSFSAGTEVNGVLQYMGATGARAVQCIPKIIHLTAGQKVFLASRCRGTAGTHDASHESTFLQVEYLPFEEWT